MAAKIDPALADIQRAALSVDPATPIRVIVFGPSAAAAGTAADATPGRSLAGAGAASMVVAAKDLNTLADARGVSYVVADLPVAPTSSLDEEPTFSALASLVPDIDRAPAAWRAGLTGAGVGIAVIDSGVAPDGVFGRRLVEVPLGGSGDAYGHGTFVAGVAAGSGDGFSGIAPGARVYGVGVARGNAVYTSDVLAGLEWVLANHARLHIRVVTLSLSETVPSSYVADPLDTAVEQLWKAGVVVVVSAGNLGPNSAVFAPANDPFAITVGATDPAGTLDASDDFVATFSSSGVTLDGVRKPDVLAPGRHVVSLLPTGSALADAAPAQNRLTGEFATMSGTSFSAPQVAGAAALLLQRHRTWTPDQVKWVLVNSARPLEGSVAGSLDVGKATTFRGVPGRTGAGLHASKFGLKGQKTASFRAQTAQAPKWDASTWNASTWNASTWNASTWNASTWNAWDRD